MLRLIVAIACVSLFCVSLPAGFGSCASAQDPKPAVDSAPATARIVYTQFRSESLNSDVRCAISLPASYDRDPKRRFPVVIFLHGLFNDERDWERRGMAGQLDTLRAEGRVGEFIVAMPYGANSFYLNGKDGTRYEDAIVKDFLPWVDTTYRTTGSANGRMIEGLSMGGFGALTIAFKHPDLFAAVAAHSAAVFEQLPKPPASSGDPIGSYRYRIASSIFGAPPDEEFFKANNPLDLARAKASGLKNLKIYFDCGKQDRYGFAEGNVKLSAVLTEQGVAHEFHLEPGDHGWPFLTSRADKAMEFCWKTVGAR